MATDQTKADSEVIQDLLEPDVRRYLKYGLWKTTDSLVKASHSSSADETRALGKKHYAECRKRVTERINEIFATHRILDKKRELDVMTEQQEKNGEKGIRRLTGTLKHDVSIIADVINTRELDTELELLNTLKKRQEELVNQITNHDRLEV